MTRAIIIAVLALALAPAAQAQTQVSVTQPATLTITIVPVLTAVNFAPAPGVACTAGTATACTGMGYTGGPNNAGAKIADVNVVTNPPGGSTAGVTLAIASCTQQPGGSTCTPGDGSTPCCALTATSLPASVTLLPTNVPAATYRYTVTATAPAAAAAGTP